MENVSKGTTFYQWHAGTWQAVNSGVIAEQPVSLTVNGEVWLSFMCTPAQLEALAVGFLFNEGFIQGQQEIESVRVCATGDNVDVWLNHAIERPREWRRTSGCTGGVTSNDGESQPASDSDASLSSVPALALDPAEISALINQLFDRQDLYKKVGGVHSSALSDGRQVLVSADDIGRHNTLDKIAGICLLEGINPERKLLTTTGRISSEMIQKAARIGAAVTISRTSPTSKSIELAQRWGIMLIGYARRDRFNVYTFPERLQAAQLQQPGVAG